jgi:molybdate transport system substrate-binding protein
MLSALRNAVFAVLCLAAPVTPSLARAADVKVAVAANFSDAARDLATAFNKQTGNTVTLSVGASGAFLTQIEQGAPFEVFLSADTDRPARLEADGYGVAGTRFTYARGALVLWSATPGFVDDKGAVLAGGHFEHISIADPASAPYGTAAIETLKSLRLYDRLSTKIVKGTSIAQAYTFIDSGSAELGFVALSQVIRTAKGSMWRVPENLHSPIEQQAILLTPGRNDPAAHAWLAFLKSPAAAAIIRSYGYGVK